MKKLFIIFLIFILCSNHLSSMDEPTQVSQTSILHTVIENEVRNKHLIQQFKWGKNTLLHKEIAHRIKTFRNVNTSWRAFFDHPVVFRTIVHNYFSYMPYCNSMMDAIRSLQLTSAEPYFKVSQALNKNINTLTKKQIKEYIDNGADVNYCDNLRRPVLFIADVSRTKILLELGANPNIELSGDETPLLWAIDNKHKFSRKRQLSQIKLLLARNPRKKCLPAAICLQDKEIVKLILKKGSISGKELTEATQCAHFSFPPGLELLSKYTEKIDIKLQSIYLRLYLLNDLKKMSTIPEIEALTYAGANVNYAPCDESEHMLMLVCDKKNYALIQLLLAHGADLNATYKSATPLMIAIRQRDILLAQLLLAYKPKNLCLSFVVNTDNLRMAQLFLENNISLNDLSAYIHESFKEKKLKVATVFVDAYLGHELMMALFRYNDRHPKQRNQIMPILDRLWLLSNPYLTNFRKNALNLKNLKKTRKFVIKYNITREELFEFICRSLEDTVFQGRDKKMTIAPYITIYLGAALTKALLNMFQYNDEHPQQCKEFLPIIKLLCNLPDESLKKFRENIL